MSSAKIGPSSNHDFVLDDYSTGRRTAVREEEGEVTLFQQHEATLSADYWNTVAVRTGELKRLRDALESGPLPDELRGGLWKTDASVRDRGEYITLVQSSSGAGGRNGDSVRLTRHLLNRIFDRL